MYQVEQAHVDERNRGVPQAGARLGWVAQLQQLRRRAGQDVCWHAHLRAKDLCAVPHTRYVSLNSLTQCWDAEHRRGAGSHCTCCSSDRRIAALVSDSEMGRSKCTIE